MSTEKPATNTKDVYGVSQQNVDKYFDGIKQQVPRYHQSVTNVQQESLDAFENIINSTIALKAIKDTTEEIVKASTIQNQIALAAIDATQQNIKTFNDNAKAFADLNKNILQSWISAFTQRNN